MFPTGDGALRTRMDALLPDIGAYSVTNSQGVETFRVVKPTGIPWVRKGERAKLSIKPPNRLSSTPPNNPTVVRDIAVVLVTEDGSVVSGMEFPEINIYHEDGTPIYLFGFTPEQVLEQTVDVIAYNNKTEASPIKGETKITKNLSDNTKADVFSREEVRVNENMGLVHEEQEFTHKPSGLKLISRGSFQGYSPAVWTKGPPTDDTNIILEGTSEAMVGVVNLVVDTPYGAYEFGVDLRSISQADAAPIEFEWLTDPAAVILPTLRELHVSDVRYFTAKPQGGDYVFSSGGDATFDFSFIVSDKDGRVLSSGPSVSYEDGLTYQLSIRGKTKFPIEIHELKIGYGRYEQSVKRDPIPPPSQTTYEVPQGGDGGSGSGEYVCVVPPGTRRIFRHPMMTPGANVTTDKGRAYWESSNFLILPQGATMCTWDRAGQAGVISGSAPRNDLPTSYTWGGIQLRKTNSIPAEIETNLLTDFSPIASYTPNISVNIGGMDGTLDLTSAGNLSATFEGDFDKVTGGLPSLNGADFTITLDGVTIEWGKVVSYHASSTDEGSTVQVSALDPLDFHNIDLNLMFQDQRELVNPFKDLGAHAQQIAGKMGLNLIGGGNLSFPTNLQDDTEDESSSTVFGNTATQELELVANAALCTVVTDVPTKSIKFLPLERLSGGGGSASRSSIKVPTMPGKSGSCAFIGRGYDLSQGYGIVEVTGVSNTVRIFTKMVDLPISRQGSTGQSNEVAVEIIKHSGAGQLVTRRNYAEEAAERGVRFVWAWILLGWLKDLLHHFIKWLIGELGDEDRFLVWRDREDMSGDYWPVAGNKGAISARGGLWIEFTKKQNNEIMLMPLPIKYNLENTPKVSSDSLLMSSIQQAGSIAGAFFGFAVFAEFLQKFFGTQQDFSAMSMKEKEDYVKAKYADGGIGHLNEPGMPVLSQTVAGGRDPLSTYRITNVNTWKAANGPQSGWAIGSEQRGWFSIDDVEFLVETPAQIRARFSKQADACPDSFGPCVTAFRVKFKDTGLFGYEVAFRVGFVGTIPDESSISIVAFVCPATVNPGASALPHKKVTVQNPFIVQEKPKSGDYGNSQDTNTSEAFKRGVALANALTLAEAAKRNAGEVKILGGASGSIGDSIEGYTIIDRPTSQIVPGEACWTMFKVKS